MKRILLLTYYFPPCNLTASQRPYSWARYLNRFGYYPIVITRNWEVPIAEPRDAHRAAGLGVVHEICDGYEVYRVPFVPGWRDRLFTHGKGRVSRLLQRMLTLLEMFGQNLFWWVPSYRNLFRFALDYAKQNRSNLHGMVATANPYTMFFFGYAIHRKTGLPWVADYRDDWTSRNWGHWFNSVPVLGHLGRWLETRNERRWLATSSGLVSVSPHYVNSIAAHVKRSGAVVFNGYVEEDFAPFRQPGINAAFTVVYNGTLIPMQKVEIFLTVWKRLAEHYADKVSMKAIFMGTGYDAQQRRRIESFMLGFEHAVQVTDRMPRTEAIRLQCEAHVLLMIAYGSVKGSPGTKVFDYLGCHKPILLCPSDHEVLESIIAPSGLGMIADTEEELEPMLEEALLEFMKTGTVSRTANAETLNQYSREHQARLLAQALDDFWK